MIPPVVILAGVFAGAAVFTGLVRRYALRRNLLDIPNARSSHTTPTPRGGGLGIVAAFLPALALLGAQGLLDARTAAALAGGLPVAGIGYYDDHRGASPLLRIAVHFAASIWAVAALGGMPPLDLGFGVWQWGLLGDAAGVVGLVWLINLYNFMDGIDGLEGSETVFAGAAAGLTLMSGGAHGLAWSAWLLAGACAGFLLWNWPPARIFMGDVGSGFLGFALGVFAIAGAGQGALAFWPWLILLGVFIVDTTITLARRVLRGERWYQAHRSHAYQHATQQWNSHLKVTLGIMALNLVWLLPLAWAAAQWPGAALVITIAAWVPLVYLALHFNAGCA
ncbi:MAG: glycosyltransferase family 4 protein [Anaerolineae bacterium]|nr:glycosyltransferase family 4 protein [Anaerolineae bacterium]